MSGRITSYLHDGLTFDVRDEGPLDGTPVLLLHGFPERAGTWRHVAPLLHAQGFRTVAPDQRGYSPGARPRRRRDYTLPLLVDDAAALIAEIGRPVHVVGHDWGAAVGYLLAAECPDLVRTLTAVAVPHSAAFVRAMPRSRQGLASWYMLAFQLPRVPEMLARRAGGPMERGFADGGMTPEEIATFRREIVEQGALTGALNWYRAMPFTRPGAVSRRVTVPTTLVWGDADTAVLRSTVERTADWVDGDYRLVVLPGVSHWIPSQAPEELARHVLERISP
ncbi:alpha/beta fold hydrolase [Nocardioides sp. LS1]|uniref:alpha/beta fold hydrolase n=1 Tax=Nocardioides sp. LS1 TaxID=1027620 RepID=UPI000F61C434|nr:alpha/beta fold hydrolase [Nocardioides sp. LS1]GCD91513.1 alpha/beta hydrolase [Nocardioides sp. LS1]